MDLCDCEGNDPRFTHNASKSNSAQCFRVSQHVMITAIKSVLLE